MYAHISGTVAEIIAGKESGSLVIDCGGVGYLLSVSNTTLSQGILYSATGA